MNQLEQICRRCQGTARLSKAIVNPPRYSEDFSGDAGQYGTTISPDLTRAELVDCWKCEDCGQSWKLESEFNQF